MLRNALLIILSIARAVSGPSVCPQAVLAPSDTAYHAAHPDFGIRDDDASSEAVRDFVQLSGKRPVWSYVSFHWDRGIVFPKDACDTLHSEGVIPLVGMMPWSSLAQNRAEKVYTLDAIISGKFDRELAECARAVRDLGYPIMIEFGPECTGSWFPWSGAWNGAGGDTYGERGVPDGPERFRDAYRHVVDIFREEGADCVTWAFHIDSRPAPAAEWNAAKWYYPGDSYVDWVGFSAYGRLRRDAPQLPFEMLADRACGELDEAAPGKPIAVFELGTVEGKPGEKAQWIREAFAAAERRPKIRALAWWNKTLRSDGTPSTMEISSSPEALEAYRDAVRALESRPRLIKR